MKVNLLWSCRINSLKSYPNADFGVFKQGCAVHPDNSTALDTGELSFFLCQGLRSWEIHLNDATRTNRRRDRKNDKNTRFADVTTTAMREAIDETYRRRGMQESYNIEHGITPQGIRKAIKDITDRVKIVAETKATYEATPVSRDEIARLVKDLESQMKKAAKNLEFEKAALLRDRIIELRKDEELLSPLVKPK